MPKNAEPAFPIMDERSGPRVPAIGPLRRGMQLAQRPRRARISGYDNSGALQAFEGRGVELRRRPIPWICFKGSHSRKCKLRG